MAVGGADVVYEWSERVRRMGEGRIGGSMEYRRGRRRRAGGWIGQS